MISNKPLPAGWYVAQLPELAQINPAYPTELPADDTVVSFVPMASVEPLTGRLDPSNHRPWHDVKKGYTRFQDGDVLFAKITPCMENGKAAVARGLSSGYGAGSTEFHVLRPCPPVRAELLLHYVLQEEFRRTARANMTGTAGQLRVPSRFFDEQTMPVPPVREQLRIVEAIESYFSRLDDAMATLERVQRNLKRYRASVLKAAVEGRLVPTEAELARVESRSYEPASVLLQRILAERRRRWEQAALAKMTAKGKAPNDDKWKAKYVEPVLPDTSALPELPEGWCWASVDQLVLFLEQGWSPRCESRAVASPKEWGVIKTSAVQHMAYVEDANKALPSKLKIRPHLEVIPDDILVTRAGPRVRVGVCCLVRNTSKRLLLCDKVYRLRTNPATVDPVYMELALNSSRVLDLIERIKSGISDSGLNLTQDKFSAMALPLPPRQEQTRIGASVSVRFSIAKDVAKEGERACAGAIRLRQSVLKWAFEGRLVDQDPNDEPASVLLERIRDERTSSAAKRSPRARGRKTTAVKA